MWSCYDDINRHNWHHKYPFDYAASEFGVGKQFNPTKLFIDVCCLLGLASDCKRATGAWAKLKAQRERGDEAHQYEGKTDVDRIMCFDRMMVVFAPFYSVCLLFACFVKFFFVLDQFIINKML